MRYWERKLTNSKVPRQQKSPKESGELGGAQEQKTGKTNANSIEKNAKNKNESGGCVDDIMNSDNGKGITNLIIAAVKRAAGASKIAKEDKETGGDGYGDI